MNYTRNLVEMSVTAFFPYGDKIVEAGNAYLEKSEKTSANPLHTPAGPKINKREEKARIGTANLIMHAVKEGKIDPSFAKIADNMKTEGKRLLAENRYANNQYKVDQFKKVAPILDVVIPRAGTIVTTVANTLTANNLQQYSKENPSYKETAIKTAKFVVPIMVGATSTLWMPFVAPWMTVGIMGAGVASVVGGAAALDAINYWRG